MKIVHIVTQDVDDRGVVGVVGGLMFFSELLLNIFEVTNVVLLCLIYRYPAVTIYQHVVRWEWGSRPPHLKLAYITNSTHSNLILIKKYLPRLVQNKNLSQKCFFSSCFFTIKL